MNSQLTNRIALILAPHLQKKHKDTLSIQIAEEILSEIRRDAKEQLKYISEPAKPTNLDSKPINGV